MENDNNKEKNAHEGNKAQQGTLKATLPLKVALSDILESAFYPDVNTVVTGALSPEKVEAAAKAGVEHIINFQPESELTFDEKAAAVAYGIAYTHLPIANPDDLKQVNILDFDKALRLHHGQKTLMHCQTGNRVGACVTLRAGWLRGRKMDTAIERGKSHGLTGLEEEVRMRLLVPR